MSGKDNGLKKKAPKKKRIIFKRKPIFAGSIVAIFAIAGITTGIFIWREQPIGGTCSVGLIGITHSIEPIFHQFEHNDEIIINQVVETLFNFDYTDDQPKLVGNLAESWIWNKNATELTCYLREGVRFHDGTPFNATAVKWNIDRIYRLVNSWFSYLFWAPFDGVIRRAVNETQVVDEYTVKFVLNGAYVPFLHLLTNIITGMVSPTSTPADQFLNIDTDKLVGTGPFVYDHHELHTNITMFPNPHYWGPKPKIDELVFLFYDELTEEDDLWNAILAKEIDILDPLFSRRYPNWTIQTFKNDPGITVREGLPISFQYIGMNTNFINITMRKAISYAVNYTYMVEDILPHRAVRARSPIPKGILYSNTTSIDVPYYNISLARKILKDAGWPGTSNLTADDDISPGNEWELLVNNLTPIANYTFDYSPFGIFSPLLAKLLQVNLKQIGVKIINQTDWSIPQLQLYTLGWIYDYNDPHSGMILFASPAFNFNLGRLNDSLVDQWIRKGMQETDPTLRRQIYYNIQKRLIEELYPHILCYSEFKLNIHVSDLKGYPTNPFRTILKSVYFV
ncbi:MAG: ABC transporter substrate-binding protein [Promethearchaeota archaeon]|jgi:ABC-type transport system substrate-binding protein